MKKAEEEAIGMLSDKLDESFIPSGISELDELIGGGFARGRITEIYGNEGIGKTWLVSKLMANLSKDQTVLFVDAEFSLNKARVTALGADVKNIGYVADSRLENVSELLTRAVGQFDVIILDSIASLIPTTIENQEVGESANIGLYARLIKQWVMKFRPRLGKSKTAFIAINQMRKPIGLYATIETPGGKAWHHTCDVRIKLHANSADKKESGHYVHAEVTKSKLSQPFKTTKFFLEY